MLVCEGMAVISPARRVAFEVLKKVHGGGFSDVLLHELTQPLEGRDAGLAHEIVYGVLRHQNQLDFLIHRFSGRTILTIDEATAILLRMGIYQLRYLSRIPAHAAVMEAVELAKRSSKRAAAGFCNAVLRKVHKRELAWPDEATELALPHWLFDKWRGQFGPAMTRSIALASLKAPEKTMRDGRRMDMGAQNIVPLLELEAGQRFLDLCAAPGNKTRQALETPICAIAADRPWKRLRSLEDLGIPLVQLDASTSLPFGPVFDRILADVPCSGTGTLGRNPEIKWRLDPTEITRQQERQIAILRNALAALAPGGQLVYSTCSLEKEENEDVVQAVLGDAPRQESRRIPGQDPGEGFYACLIRNSS